MKAATVRVTGVDGCRAGWLAVAVDDRLRIVGARVFATARELARATRGAAVVAIDIPIGLTDAGPRQCDLEARRALGRPRASSVFAAPLRGMLQVQSYADVCAQRRSVDGRSVSKQAFNILPKVREVDTLLQLQPELRGRLVEVHPELCFRALNGGCPMRHGKSTSAGKLERRVLLDPIFDAAAIDAIRDGWPRSQVADDDIHDALAVAWTGLRIVRGESVSLPSQPPLDGVGLPMRIVF